MDRTRLKVSKACEPCRRRKIRCNGNAPCLTCQEQPSLCVYRSKARVRGTATHTPRQAPGTEHQRGIQSPRREALGRSTESSPRPTPVPNPDEVAASGVYNGVSAARAHSNDIQDHTLLFYGPSSNLAFIQQLRRGILGRGVSSSLGSSEGSEGGEHLDMFTQHDIFFGTESRAATTSSTNGTDTATPLSVESANVYLRAFKDFSWGLLPFFPEPELDNMILRLRLENHRAPPASQQKALALAILAIGALITPDTTIAETLYEQAKSAALPFDELVSLSMIQLPILLAEYQIHMGRPNSAYVHLGTATRKALAAGLQAETSGTASHNDFAQKRRCTMWSLYFHEQWHGLAMGRPSALKLRDIQCRFPDDHYTLLEALRDIAHIAEINAEEMYTTKSASLLSLYSSAERTHTKLQHFAQKFGLSSPSTDVSNEQSRTGNNISRLILNNVYYHAVILTFRPFLVAEALAAGKQKNKAMWLRKACRHATDAAEDYLVVIQTFLAASEEARRPRFTAFFIESSCLVLLYDVLWHPSKSAYHLEHVNIGLQCLEQMIDAAPVVQVRRSLNKIVATIEQLSVGADRRSSQGNAPLSSGRSALHGIAETHNLAAANFPTSLNVPSPLAEAGGPPQNMADMPLFPPAAAPTIHTGNDPNNTWPSLDYILTTDLYEFLPEFSDESGMGSFAL